MARSVQITAPENLTDKLLSDLNGLDGIIGIRLQRRGSVQPPGDVIGVEVLNRTLPELSRLLERHGMGTDESASLTTAQPLSVISPQLADQIANDSSEATWEEMDLVMAAESNMTVNGLLIMAASGAVATVGLAQNALHLVIGAMVIAPGFEPIVRAALGGVTRSRASWIGALQLLQGYAALVIAAALTAVVLGLMGTDPRGPTATYLPAGVLVEYWTSLTAMSLLVTAIAGAAGAVLITVNRSVLTAGVMIALALVPSAAIMGIGLASGDLGLAAQGALRWLAEVAIVAVMSVLVIAWKRQMVHRRRMA